MNRPQHMIAGACVSTAVYLYVMSLLGEQPYWGELLLCASGGAAVGILPDVFEPALSPHHRSFFHSVFVLGVLGYLSYRYYHKQNLSGGRVTAVLNALGAAYGSHLVLDACTAMGLPWLKRGC